MCDDIHIQRQLIQRKALAQVIVIFLLDVSVAVELFLAPYWWAPIISIMLSFCAGIMCGLIYEGGETQSREFLYER